MNRAMRRASIANGRKMMKQGWTGWEDWTDRAKATATFASRPNALEKFWKNGIYTVQQFTKESAIGPIVHLMVRRNDEGPVHSWSDLQRVKDELIGAHRTAVEVYPAANNLVDQANMYHLWVLPEGYELPFGLHRRSP